MKNDLLLRGKEYENEYSLKTLLANMTTRTNKETRKCWMLIKEWNNSNKGSCFLQLLTTPVKRNIDIGRRIISQTRLALLAQENTSSFEWLALEVKEKEEELHLIWCDLWMQDINARRRNKSLQTDFRQVQIT